MTGPIGQGAASRALLHLALLHLALLSAAILPGPSSHADTGADAGAPPPSAEVMLGLSPCAFFPEPPPPGHPIRKGAMASAFRLLDTASRNRRGADKAVAAFVRAREGLLAEATRAFAVRGDDPTDFQPAAAQRFLQRHVLAPNAPLRVGRDGFELAEPVVRGLMLAACWAGDGERVVSEARRVTGPSDDAVRAAGALWLVFQPPRAASDLREAAQLVGDAPPVDFLRAFLLAEIASRGDDAEDARAKHALATTLVKTADQHEALRSQGRRLDR